MSSIYALIPELDSPDHRVRLNAANELVKAGTEVMPALTGVLRDRQGRYSIQLRTRVANLLGEIRDVAAIDSLREAFDLNLLILTQSLDPTGIMDRSLFDSVNPYFSYLCNQVVQRQIAEVFKARGALGAEILAALEKIADTREGGKIATDAQQYCSTCNVEFVLPTGGLVVGTGDAISERVRRRPTYCSSCDALHCMNCAFEASRVRNLDFNCCPVCGKEVPDDWAANS